MTDEVVNPQTTDTIAPVEPSVTVESQPKKRGPKPKSIVQEVDQKIEDADMVIVEVPKKFKILISHLEEYTIEQGVQKMKKYIASHWWAKANGVKIFDPKGE